MQNTINKCQALSNQSKLSHSKPANWESYPNLEGVKILCKLGKMRVQNATFMLVVVHSILLNSHIQSITTPSKERTQTLLFAHKSFEFMFMRKILVEEAVAEFEERVLQRKQIVFGCFFLHDNINQNICHASIFADLVNHSLEEKVWHLDLHNLRLVLFDSFIAFILSVHETENFWASQWSHKSTSI